MIFYDLYRTVGPKPQHAHHYLMRHRLELRPLGPTPSHPSYLTLARVYLGDALWLSPVGPYFLLHCTLASRECLQATPRGTRLRFWLLRGGEFQICD